MISQKLVTISVTQSDCEKGKQLDSDRCPLSLAASRTFERKVRVAVGNADNYLVEGSWINNRALSNCMIIKVDKSVIMVPLPARIVKKINHFDKTGEIKPFEFDVEIPI